MLFAAKLWQRVNFESLWQLGALATCQATTLAHFVLVYLLLYYCKSSDNLFDLYAAVSILNFPKALLPFHPPARWKVATAALLGCLQRTVCVSVCVCVCLPACMCIYFYVCLCVWVLICIFRLQSVSHYNQINLKPPYACVLSIYVTVWVCVRVRVCVLCLNWI